MGEISAMEVPVACNSMNGAIGRLHWLNSDPAGVCLGVVGPFWGRCWWSEGWWRVWSWEP